MTAPVILAGSAFAAAALWVGVYTALLPKRGPASTDAWQVSASESTAIQDLEPAETPPNRWVDLPRETPVSASDLPVRDEKLSTAIMPDLGSARNGPRLSHFPQARKAALPDLLSQRRFARERAFTPRGVHTRMRSRRKPEPIQFSLATRSSS
jgi:hypothetical protein